MNILKDGIKIQVLGNIPENMVDEVCKLAVDSCNSKGISDDDYIYKGIVEKEKINDTLS